MLSFLGIGATGSLVDVSPLRQPLLPPDEQLRDISAAARGAAHAAHTASSTAAGGGATAAATASTGDATAVEPRDLEQGLEPVFLQNSSAPAAAGGDATAAATSGSVEVVTLGVITPQHAAGGSSNSIGGLSTLQVGLETAELPQQTLSTASTQPIDIQNHHAAAGSLNPQQQNSAASGGSGVVAAIAGAEAAGEEIMAADEGEGLVPATPPMTAHHVSSARRGRSGNSRRQR